MTTKKTTKISLKGNYEVSENNSKPRKAKTEVIALSYIHNIKDKNNDQFIADIKSTKSEKVQRDGTTALTYDKKIDTCSVVLESGETYELTQFEKYSSKTNIDFLLSLPFGTHKFKNKFNRIVELKKIK